MERYEKVKKDIFNSFIKIYNPQLRQMAIEHTLAVDTCISILCLFEPYDMECARIAALLHDYCQYVDNCKHSEHARLSSEFANNYLLQTNLFSQSEIDTIVQAIKVHSNKSEIDDPFDELLKDADAWARSLNDPQYKNKRTENLYARMHDKKYPLL